VATPRKKPSKNLQLEKRHRSAGEKTPFSWRRDTLQLEKRHPSAGEETPFSWIRDTLQHALQPDEGRPFLHCIHLPIRRVDCMIRMIRTSLNLPCAILR